MKIYQCKHLGRIQGITLAPFCILIRPDKIDDIKVLKHEMKHWNDAKRLWYVGFYVMYFIEWVFKGYDNISLEITEHDKIDSLPEKLKDNNVLKIKNIK